MKDNIVCSGALFYSKSTQRFLFLYRAKGKTSNQWGLVGGTNEGCETPWEGLKREIQEEIGSHKIIKTLPLETFVSNDEKFSFHTYLCVVEEEFTPILNDEHSGYCWIEFGLWPKPLHNGLQTTLKNKKIQSKLETIIEVINLF